MDIEKQLAHYRTAYDILKGVFITVTTVLCFVVVVMTVVVYEAKQSVKLNTERYNEMREAYEIQAIYFNNMKARIEALNRESDDRTSM